MIVLFPFLFFFFNLSHTGRLCVNMPLSRSFSHSVLNAISFQYEICNEFYMNSKQNDGIPMKDERAAEKEEQEEE